MPTPSLARSPWIRGLVVGLTSLAATLFCLDAAASSSPAPRHPLRVGVAQVDITPQHPVRLSGYGSRRTEHEAIGQRIWAKALAVADAQSGAAVLVTVDNVGVPAAITAELATRLQAKLKLPPERLTVTASHTHTAPMLSGALVTLFGTDIPPEHQANIDRYTRFFVDRLEEAALAAVRDLRPAHLAWGIGRTDFAANRRTPGGPVDHDLPILVVRALDGKLRAVWFSYACHCTTLSNNRVSGDWSGFAQSFLQEKFPGAVALGSIGCGADANPNQRQAGDSTQFVEAHGHKIADEVERLLKGPLEEITAPPTTEWESFKLPLAPARTRSEWEERARQNDAVGYHARLNLARLDRGEKIPDHVPYSVQTWRFGEQLALVFLPGEVVVDYSLRLKKEFDATRFAVVAYANAAPCYIPSERILREGGYEGGGAMIYYDQPQIFATGLEDRIIQSVHQQVPAAFACPPGTEGIAPRSPERSRQAWQTKPGLAVELVAAEPLIQSPVSIDWDARGRLWVVEMPDYPAGLDGRWQPGGRVKILEDTNHDGVFDRATVFADQIPFPTGATVWGRGALICTAPNILYGQDLNHDGRAEQLDTLFSGFATDNFQARVNSLTLGLDNWIYGANGLLGGRIQGTFAPAALPGQVLTAKVPNVDIRNRDFRFDPATGAFEAATGLSQQGRVRDDWGNWFGCDNSRAVAFYPLPEHYLRRNPYVAAPESNLFVPADPDPGLLFPASRLLARFNDLNMANRVTSACGVEIYRDTLLGEELHGNAFTCECVHNLVTRQELSTDGILFTGHRAPEEKASEFLASRDNWSRPVQVRTGPDGALYIVDFYRFLIEHPRWIPAERLAQINVRAGAEHGRIYRVVPTQKRLRPIANLENASASSLAQQLNSPNGTERDRVHRELLLRQDRRAAPQLTKLAANARLPEVRLQALCVLDGLQALTPDLLRRALRDPHEQVRRHAVRLAEHGVRGELSATEQAALRSLWDEILKLAADPSLAVRFQLAFTLGESADPRAADALAQLLAQDSQHPYLRAAVLSSAKPHATALLRSLAARPQLDDGLQEAFSQLVLTAAATADLPGLRTTLDVLLPAPGQPAARAKLAAYSMFLTALDRRQLALSALLAGASANPSHPPRLRQLQLDARRLAQDAQAPQADREAALRTLGRNAETLPEDIEWLATAVTDSPELRAPTLAVLQRLRQPLVATRLLRDWSGLSPSTRNAVLTLLLSREEWMAPLLESVDRGTVPANDIPLAERTRLSASTRPETRALAAKLFQSPARSARDSVVAAYSEVARLTGDATHGREVFTKQCSSCHALDGLGFRVGPDLATLGSKDVDYWVKNILDPNAVIVPQFTAYEIETRDGRSLSGVIQNEASTSLTLVQGGGVTETILRTEVASLRSSTLSLMPEGLEAGIPPQDMADLLAFARRPPVTTDAKAGSAPVTAGADRSLLLPATAAQLRGGDIKLESDFNNIGMWHGQEDTATWHVLVAQPGDYDVHLDYACHPDAAGNAFALSAGRVELRGTIAATGGWDQYRQVKLGRVALTNGPLELILRPAGPVRGALLDLRNLKLVPAGESPRWVLPTVAAKAALPPGFSSDHVARTPAAVASVILDPSRPRAERETILNANPQYCADLIREMTQDLPPGEKEYERIPWIWRIAIATGLRNDAAQLLKVLQASLPTAEAPLRDWQAVVIGGGLINGLSQRGEWPGRRLDECLGDDAALRGRWTHALEQAQVMAENAAVAKGTRYDALRMLGVEPWEKHGARLSRFLTSDTDPELQMGAVSALVDVDAPEAAQALIAALSGLTDSNRKLALDGLVAREKHALKLLEALASQQVKGADLGDERRQRLLQHNSAAVRQKASVSLK